MEPIDTRGPIYVPLRKVIVEPQRVEAQEAAFVPPPPKPGPWHGEWIWIAESDDTPLAALFRRVIDLERAPKTVHLFVTADVRYRLFVNGNLAARGPADVGRDYDTPAPGPWLYDVRDVSHLFHRGRNVIAVEVYSEPLVSSEGTTGYPGLLLDAEMRLPDGNLILVGTDTLHWKGIPAPHVFLAEGPEGSPIAGRYCYHVDAGREPIAWQRATFDDSHWPAVVRARGERALPLLSEIPPMLEAVYPAKEFVRVSESMDARISRNGTATVRVMRDGTFALRYDRVICGFIGLHVDGIAGASLTLMPNEVNAPGFHRAARILLRNGPQFVELPFFDSFSVINVQVDGVTAPFEINDIQTVFTSYPVAYRGSFSCSDPHWNRLWNASRWALQLCLQTHHLDSPHHQEPICDPGDYLIEAQMNYYAFGDRFLARQDLRKFARILHQSNFRNFHTSYALLWLRMLLDYYDFTGDIALVTELAPTVHGLLDTFTDWRGGNGLISEAPTYMFLDWVEIAGFSGHHPPAVIGQGYMTAFFYRALADGARVASLTGDMVREERYGALRTEVLTAFERELWDTATGLYRDGGPFQTAVPPGPWLPADTTIETHTPHVNILAVACDLAPKDRQKAILERIVSAEELNVQPYFMHFLFEALHHAGLFTAYAPRLLSRWQLNEDTGTFREMWDSGDFSHAWGGTPLIQMSRRILGVEPLTPGFATVAIRPTLCHLTFAQGTIPTPHGEVKVSWRRKPAFTLTVETPVDAEITLPAELGIIARIRADGKEQALSGKTLAINPGRHQCVVMEAEQTPSASDVRRV